MVTLRTNGKHEFRVYLPHASRVELVAEFTDWNDNAIELSPDGDAPGWWTAALEIPPGDHTFTYLVDSRWCMPDYAASGLRRDHHGNWVSTLSCATDRPGQNAETKAPRYAPADLREPKQRSSAWSARRAHHARP